MKVFRSADRVWRVEVTDVYRVWWNGAELTPVRTPAQLEDLMQRHSDGKHGLGDLIED